MKVSLALLTLYLGKSATRSHWIGNWEGVRANPEVAAKRKILFCQKPNHGSPVTLVTELSPLF